MAKLSASSRASAWLAADKTRTQSDAARKFGITQGAISSTKAREDHAIATCIEMPELVAKVSEILHKNPLQTHKGIATFTGCDEGTARIILLGIQAQKARADVMYDDSGANMGDVTDDMAAGSRYGYDCGFEHGVKKRTEDAAQLMRMIGGEHGEAMAQAIEAL